MLISDFARLGQVSVRMLRHYDALGLLKPAQIDSSNGYRSYSPEQLHTLNRVVALKGLGFSLDQVRRLLQDEIGGAEMRGMLRLRRAQLEHDVAAASVQLVAVETRLQMIDKEDSMPTDYVVKTVPAVRLIARTAVLDPDRLGEHIELMFAGVAEALDERCGSLATPIAVYAETESGMEVAAGYADDGPAPDGTTRIALRETTAVCGVHLGPMAGVQDSWQQLHRWALANGYTFAGPSRELYVRARSEDQADWVTELQQPVAPPQTAHGSALSGSRD